MEIPHPYAYTIVRKDLPIHQQLVQSAHSSHYAGFRGQEPKETCSLIVLQVDNELDLFRAMRHCEMNGIRTTPFWEPDWDYGLTAFTTEVLLTRAQRQHMFKFPLWTHGDTNPNLTTEMVSTAIQAVP